MRKKLRTSIGLSFLCVIVLSGWATRQWGTPNHTPPEELYIGCPAENLCVDRNGWLWWGDQLGRISVATEVDVGELRPLDTLELDDLHSRDSLCLFVPRTGQSGVYALTRSGRLLLMSVSDSRLSAMELADFGRFFTDACVADDSFRTIVASNWDQLFLIDLPDRTISPLSVPVPEGIVDLGHAGGTRFIVAFVNGTICLFDSDDIMSPVNVVKAPEFPGMLTASPDRTLMALDGDSQPGGTVLVVVRNSGTLEEADSWQVVADESSVSDITWLDDRRLAASLRTYRRRGHGEVVILQLGSDSRRRVKLDFEPWSLLAIAPNRLAISDRDGGVRVIELDP